MITSNNRTHLFYGSQKIRSRYLGSQLIWGDNLDVQSITFTSIFLYYTASPYAFYNYSAARIQLDSSDAQSIKGKNIVSVELDGKKSDVEWTFPTSGSSLNENYLTAESTATTFTQVQNKIKSDYGIYQSSIIKNVVVYYTA